MVPRHVRPRRLLLPAVLAAVLATELTGIAIARSMSAGATTAAPPGTVAATSDGRDADRPASVADVASDGAVDASRDPTATRTATRLPSAATLRAPAGPLHATAAATSHRPSPTRSAVPTRRTTTTAFHGRNHVWIPGLGVSAGVRWFSCSRSQPPNAGVYRWGCGGRNNVYLLGHAWSTFRALHDAYVRGRLRTGLKVWYADAAGRVHEYSVVWWRVVAPTTAASWAWASQSRPSMTLQTCVGARSQYRLMVRLLQVR